MLGRRKREGTELTGRVKSSRVISVLINLPIYIPFRVNKIIFSSLFSLVSSTRLGLDSERREREGGENELNESECARRGEKKLKSS